MIKPDISKIVRQQDQYIVLRYCFFACLQFVCTLAIPYCIAKHNGVAIGHKVYSKRKRYDLQVQKSTNRKSTELNRIEQNMRQDLVVRIPVYMNTVEPHYKEHGLTLQNL